MHALKMPPVNWTAHYKPAAPRVAARFMQSFFTNPSPFSFLLCQGLIACNSGMAGCPKAPPSACEERNDLVMQRKEFVPEGGNPRKFKTLGSGRRPVNSSSNRQQPSAPIAKNHKVDYEVDTTSAVGTLIGHFLKANEELRHHCNDRDDVLRLARDATLAEDTAFEDFVFYSNKE